MNTQIKLHEQKNYIDQHTITDWIFCLYCRVVVESRNWQFGDKPIAYWVHSQQPSLRLHDSDGKMVPYAARDIGVRRILN